MRVPFQLNNFETLTFTMDGNSYHYEDGNRLAVKPNPAANMEDSVLEMPDGKVIYLTVVGADDGASAQGIRRGWYVAQTLDAESATKLVIRVKHFSRCGQL